MISMRYNHHDHKLERVEVINDAGVTLVSVPASAQEVLLALPLVELASQRENEDAIAFDAGVEIGIMLARGADRERQAEEMGEAMDEVMFRLYPHIAELRKLIDAMRNQASDQATANHPPRSEAVPPVGGDAAPRDPSGAPLTATEVKKRMDRAGANHDFG